MRAKRSSITPAVLAWAIAEDGRQPQEIAEAVGVDEATLDTWAHGEEQPTIGQVTDLATALRRPRAVFFLPAPPTGATLAANYRHPPGARRDAGPVTRRTVRQARRVQWVLAEALADTDPVEVPRASLTTPADKAAWEARQWLGVSVEDQRAWNDDYAALNAWRRALDERGVFVFSFEIDERLPKGARSSPDRQAVRGFSAWNDHAPLIVVNSKRVSPAARVYTLGHELGHLVMRMDAACIEGENRPAPNVPVERWCEEFSGHLLMPGPAVASVMRWRGVTGPTGDVDDVRALSATFGVSHRAAAVRLINLGLARPGLYAAVEQAYSLAVPPRDDDAPPRKGLACPSGGSDSTVFERSTRSCGTSNRWRLSPSCA